MVFATSQVWGCYERCLLPQATLGVGQWRVSVNTHLPTVLKKKSENDLDLRLPGI
jgi:hypothetical protein